MPLNHETKKNMSTKDKKYATAYKINMSIKGIFHEN